jgi:hypothetical protein
MTASNDLIRPHKAKVCLIVSANDIVIPFIVEDFLVEILMLGIGARLALIKSELEAIRKRNERDCSAGRQPCHQVAA